METMISRIRDEIRSQLESQDASVKRWVVFPDVVISCNRKYKDLVEIDEQLSKNDTYEVNNIVYFRANK